MKHPNALDDVTVIICGDTITLKKLEQRLSEIGAFVHRCQTIAEMVDSKELPDLVVIDDGALSAGEERLGAIEIIQENFCLYTEVIVLVRPVEIRDVQDSTSATVCSAGGDVELLLDKMVEVY